MAQIGEFKAFDKTAQLTAREFYYLELYQAGYLENKTSPIRVLSSTV